MTRYLVDTSVWSLSFRRESQENVKDLMAELIVANQVELIGSIRQEVLSGISDDSAFQTLQSKLSVFPDLPISSEDYIKAAYFYNQCRSKGVQGSHTDFLIVSVAYRYGLTVLTADKDFLHFARFLPLEVRIV